MLPCFFGGVSRGLIGMSWLSPPGNPGLPEASANGGDLDLLAIVGDSVASGGIFSTDRDLAPNFIQCFLRGDGGVMLPLAALPVVAVVAGVVVMAVSMTLSFSSFTFPSFTFA